MLPVLVVVTGVLADQIEEVMLAGPSSPLRLLEKPAGAETTNPRWQLDPHRVLRRSAGQKSRSARLRESCVDPLPFERYPSRQLPCRVDRVVPSLELPESVGNRRVQTQRREHLLEVSPGVNKQNERRLRDHRSIVPRC